MISSISDTTALHNEVEMPWFGLGVLHVPDGEIAKDVVAHAVKVGYRLIDTAAVYGNEQGVGEGLTASGVDREEIFVTSKVWNSDQGYDQALAAFEASMKRLNLDYLDLYLIHWPGPDPSVFVETWRALEHLYESGRVRAIGVSNFNSEHLEQLSESSQVVPMVNQVEFHPRLQQPELIQYCQSNGILVEAWRPIMKGTVGELPLLVKIAERHGKTPVQVTIRWVMERGLIAIPKSQNPERIIENAQVFDFALTADEIEQINKLDAGERMGPEPATFDLDFAT